MNQQNQWSVSKRASEALVPCVPVGGLVATPPGTEHQKTDSSSGGSGGHPPNPAKGADALDSETAVNSADFNQQADSEAIEAWENEGDPN